MATLLELAQLSATVYGDPVNPTLIGNWTLLESYTGVGDGYFGQAYQNKATKEIVITNRGTRIASLDDILADIKLAAGVITPEQEDAVRFARKIANNPLYSGLPIIETGHSKGGSEAQAATVALADRGVMVSAVTFNSPGIGGYAVSSGPYNVLNLYDQGDAIHLAGGAHLGSSQELPAGPDTAKLAIGIPLALRAGYWGLFALAATALWNTLRPAHDIDTIIKYLTEENPSFGKTNWPGPGIGGLPAAPLDVGHAGDSLTLADASGNSSSITQSDTGGESIIWNNSDGSKGSFSEDASARQIELQITEADGSSATKTLKDGKLEAVLFDAGGNKVRSEWQYVDGSGGVTSYNPDKSYRTKIYNTDGSGTDTSFDASGAVLTELILNADGSSKETKHLPDGTNSVEIRNADWSYSYTSSNPNGSSVNRVVAKDGSGTETRRDSSGNTYTLSVDKNGAGTETWRFPDGTSRTLSVNSDGYGTGTSTYLDGAGNFITVSSSVGPLKLEIRNPMIGYSPTDGSGGAYYPSGQVSKSVSRTEYGNVYTINYFPNGGYSEISVTYPTYPNDSGHSYSYYANGIMSSAEYRHDSGIYNGVQTYSYDGYGNLLARTTLYDQGVSSNVVYQPDGSSVDTFHYPDGRYRIDNYNGYDDYLGYTSTASYDAQGIKTSEGVRFADGGTQTTYYHGDGGYHITVSDGNDYGYSTTRDYNAQGALVSYSWGSYGGVHGLLQLNSDGSSVTSLYYVDGTYSTMTDDGHNNTRTTSYDQQGRISSNLWSKADGTHGSFNSDGSITTIYVDGTSTKAMDDGRGNTMTISYDQQGIQVADSWTRSDGSHGTNLYNADGSRSGKVWYADGLSYSYTADSLGNSMTIHYSMSGRKSYVEWRSTDGSSGTDYFNADGFKYLAYKYFADGTGVMISDEGYGNTRTLEYNKQGRVVSVTWTKSDGSHGIDLFNSDNTSSGSTWNANGSMSTYIQDHSLTTTKSYDASGVLISSYWEDYYGNSKLVAYNASGDVSYDIWYSADGSRGQDYYFGDGYTSYVRYADGTSSRKDDNGHGNTVTINYNQQGIKVADSWTKADGSYGADIFNADGSFDGTAHNADGTVTILTSASSTLTADAQNLTGTSASDLTLIGNDLNNVITGNSGNDTLDGGNGSDTYIFGVGGGVDTIQDSGTTGTDTLAFGQGIIPDSLSLGLGSLLIKVGTGNDAIHIKNFNPNDVYGSPNIENFRFADGTILTYAQLVGRGFDITGSDNDDTLNGTNVVDRLYGLNGNDNLSGGDGDDALYGGAGNDTLNGGAGMDILDGGTGNDTLAGGLGNDTYLFGRGDGQDTIASDYDTTAGKLNVLQFKSGVAPGEIEATQSGSDLVLTIAGTADKVTIASFLANDDPANPYNPIQLVKFDDGTTWDMATIQNKLWIAGTAGADTLIGTAAADHINGYAGDDIIYGGDGNDVFFGGAGNDIVYGENGDDTLDGGTGNDTLIGGKGNDTYYVDSTKDKIVERKDEGKDTIVTDIDYTLPENVENLILTGTAGLKGIGNNHDNTLSGTGGNDTLQGKEGNDTLHGAEGADILAGDSGSDILYGEAGDDSLDGDSGADMMIGGSGNDSYTVDNVDDIVIELAGEGIDSVVSSVSYTLTDNVENLTLTGGKAVSGTGNALANTIIGNTSANTLDGRDGNDILTGGMNKDILYGGSGDDTLNGGGGDDHLDGGSGADTMLGGTGDDTYTVDNAADLVIEDDDKGTDGVVSTISYALTSNVENLTLAGTDAINAIGNAGNNVLTGNNSVNLLSAGVGNDILDGNGGLDFLEGMAGNDTLADSAGSGYFNGGAGDDKLTGGALADFFLGGEGDDTISTGGGSDVIVFNRGDGYDKVIVGANARETISLGGGIAYSDLKLKKSGNDLVLSIGDKEGIEFVNWYVGTANRNVLKLQVIAEAMAGFDTRSADSLLSKKVQNFDFKSLAAAFDEARAAKPGLSSWALTGALTQFHLASSDSNALGGDLAYRYGKNGTLAGIGLTSAQSIIGDALFGTQAQALKPLSGLQEGAVRLS